MTSKKRKIAVCLSNAADQWLVAEYLSGCGYEVIGPRDAGLEAADLYLLDTAFVRRMGSRVLDLKRASEIFLPSLVCLARDENAAAYLSAGFDDCLHMPVTRAELRVRLEIMIRLRQQSEELIKKSEERFRMLTESSLVGVYLIQDGIFTYVNHAFGDVFGYTTEEIVGRLGLLDLTHPDDRPIVAENIRKRLSGETEGIRYEFRGLKKDGSVIHAEVYSRRAEYSGKPCVIGTLIDNTERKKAEDALRESETRNRIITEMISDYAYIFRVSPEGELKVEWLTESFTKVFGVTREDIDARGGWLSMVLPEDLAMAREHARKVISGKSDVIEMRWVTASGDVRWLRDYAQPVFDASGKQVVRIYGAAQDITERKRAEQALVQSEECYRAVFENTGTATIIVNRDGTIAFANKECLKVTGYAPEQLKGTIWSDYVAPESLPLMREYFALRFTQPDKAPSRYQARLIDSLGRIRDCVINVGVLPNAKQIVVSMLDITELVETQRALSEREEKFRKLSNEFNALLDAIPDSLTLLDKNLNIEWANKSAVAGINMGSNEVVGRRCFSIWSGIDRPCEPCPVEETFATGMPASITGVKQGGKVWELRTVPLKDATGKVVNVIELRRDITDHSKLEDQLRQSQKLEAVGQLAGGVAHDFNNILTAIIGYANLAQMKLAQDDPLNYEINQILEASQRAVTLTQGLLAFSRKQPVNLAVVDLNEIVSRFEKLLRRLIREDIDMKIVAAGTELPVFVDRGQIEQVIMNLVTNARDAMPNGGSLTITTERIDIDKHFIQTHGYGKPGAYALLTVADTGIGIDKQTQQRIFEPFFTTKEQGKGTGLGLSMVYGIVKRHEGFINVYSEPGRGTTFKIYLPLASAATAIETKESESQPVKGGTETILIAEDDASLLRLCTTILRHFGYTVIEARDGVEAVEKFIEQKDRIRLVILDGIMPRKNGKEAYMDIKAIRPDIRAIFMSGYAEDIFTKNGIPEKAAVFVQKPISPIELARKVRKALDEKV